MKKVFLFLGALSIATISSCSSDDDSSTNPPNTNDVLVKREVYQQAGEDGFNFTADFNYSGNKLVSVVSNDGYVENYTYTGNLITKVESFLDGEIDLTETMTYNTEGQLISYSELFAGDSSATVYNFVYNSDDTVTKSQVGSGFTTTYTFANGELSQTVQSAGTTYTYTYDTKNSPFKNITGYAAIADLTAGDHELHGKARNIMSIVDETHSQNYMTNSFIYNDKGYPTQAKSTAIFYYEDPTPSEELTVTYTY